MSNLQRMAELTHEIHELAKPKKVPGRIHRIREASDELWDLWQEHYNQHLHHEQVDVTRCGCGAWKHPLEQECQRCASGEHAELRKLARSL